MSRLKSQSAISKVDNSPTQGFSESIFVTSPHVSFNCPECCLILRNPHLLSCCGSHVCECCIKIIKEEGRPCPSCKDTDYTSLINKQMRREVMAMKVRCSNSGCMWNGALSDLETHLTMECDFVECLCRYGCGGSYPRANLKIHERDECVERTMDMRIESISAKMMEKFDALEAKFESQLHSLRNKLQQQQEKLDGISSMETRYQEKMDNVSSMETRYQEKMDSISSMETRYQEKMDNVSSMETRYQDEISTLRSKLKEQQSIHAEEISMLRVQIKNVVNTSTAQQPTVVATGGPNIPDWQLPLPTSTHVLPPCFFTMVNYSDHKSKDDHYFTPPFYTHPCGYKFCLRVNANGDGDGKRTHVSLFVYVMKGEYDADLEWPFYGDITLQLLNWREDKGHAEKTLPFDENVPEDYNSRQIKYTRGKGWGYQQFCSMDKLKYNPDTNTEYLRNDTLCVRVSKVIVKSK